MNTTHFLRRNLPALALVLVAVSGCSQQATPPATGAAPRIVPLDPMKQAAASAKQDLKENQARLRAMDIADLRAKLSDAFKNQRYFSPAGENAMEYSLALRALAKDKPNASAESAIMDMLPYTVIATEQAIDAGNYDEAARLRLLIERADPTAPSLPRLRDKIADMGRANTEKALKLQAEQEAKAKEAAAKLEKQEADKHAKQAAEAAKPAPIQAPQAPANKSLEAPVAAPATTVSKPAPPKPQAPKEVPVASSGPVPLSTPQPSYPPEAYRNHVSGTVEVNIMINRDGSVGDVSIASSKPRGVFDRAVVAAVKRWKFKPMDASQTISRTFSFAP